MENAVLSQREARRANMRRIKLPAPAKGRGKVQQAIISLVAIVGRPISNTEARAWAESPNVARAMRSLGMRPVSRGLWSS